MTSHKRRYADLHEHLQALKEQGLLLTIDRPIDKDAELHPLMRWQFVGGIEEHERKAFLFTHVIDGRGRKYEFPVVVGALAGNRRIYGVGMGAPLDEIQARWDHAIANPIPPREVETACCQEVVIEGVDLLGAGHGLDSLPIPVSTPGFDSAPTLTATNVITRDPDTGVQNHGTYRAALKAPDRRGAHGHPRRWRRRLPSLPQTPEARRQDYALCDRARRPAVRGVRGADETPDRC